MTRATTAFTALALALAGCGGPGSGPGATPAPAPGPGAAPQLVFTEEFNAPALDRSVWNVVGPDMWVNNEQ